MKTSGQIEQLRALIDRADAVARTARGYWKAAIEDIQKEIVFLSGRLNIGSSAADREKVFRAIERQIARLNRRIDGIVSSQMSVAGRMGVRAANSMTGIRIEYSQKRVDAVLAAVEATGGENMAAVFTQSMSRNAIGALRSAVVGAFQEQALTGSTLREMGHDLRDRWEAAAKNEANFRFVDRAGREWETERYIQMNVRTNTMRVYNDMIADTAIRATGSDLMRISDDGRTADSCDPCQRWAGKIVSMTGATKGFPTIDDARADGVFHPNCIHTLEPVIEGVDDEEIEAQRSKNGAKK